MDQSLWSPSISTLQVRDGYGLQSVEDGISQSRTITDNVNSALAHTSGLYMLKFESDNYFNTDLRSSDGRKAYTISTQTNGTVDRPGDAIVTSLYKAGTKEPPAVYSRPASSGQETVVFLPSQPIKRANWLKFGSGFHSNVHTLKIQDIASEFTYKWTKRKEPGDAITLELRSGNSKSKSSPPIAIYKDSRRDWSIRDALVIEKASLEINPEGMHIIEHIILSLVIINTIRYKASTLQSLSAGEGMASFSIFAAGGGGF